MTLDNGAGDKATVSVLASFRVRLQREAGVDAVQRGANPGSRPVKLNRAMNNWIKKIVISIK